MNLNNIDLRKNFFFSDHWFRVSPCEDTYGDGWNGGFLKIGQTEQFCGEFESAGTVGKFDVSEAGMVSNLFFKKKKIKKKKIKLSEHWLQKRRGEVPNGDAQSRKWSHVGSSRDGV